MVTELTLLTLTREPPTCPSSQRFVVSKIDGHIALTLPDSKNMYLAEDRILCFELVSKANASWLLTCELTPPDDGRLLVLTRGGPRRQSCVSLPAIPTLGSMISDAGSFTERERRTSRKGLPSSSRSVGAGSTGRWSVTLSVQILANAHDIPRRPRFTA